MCQIFVIGNQNDRGSAAELAIKLAKKTGQAVKYVRRPVRLKLVSGPANPGGAAA